MRSLAIAVAMILGLSVGATAAEPPSLVGDWTRSVLSSANVGEHPGYHPRHNRVSAMARRRIGK